MRLFEGTEWDRPPRCERCGELESDCQCPPPSPERVAPGKQTARLSMERRRKGKMVTVIRGLPAKDNDLPQLCTQLKNTCGAGGTVDGDEIEIQGEQLDRVREALLRLGYKVKG